MKRDIDQKLLHWKDKKNRKPLILHGVRQCGKTYSLHAFGEKNFRQVFLINFEQQPDAHLIFSGELSPKSILNDVSFHFNALIDPAHDLLILDEIQSCPRAITSLKYFYEEMPNFAICAAGSLLGLSLASAAFPVGKVDFLTLRPMHFIEFLEALGDVSAASLLRTEDINQLISNISPAIHKQLWKRFTWYCVTGGLPEVVAVFVKQQGRLFDAFSEAREKQTGLITGYYADIAKHSGKQNAMHIERILDSIPTQLAKSCHAGAKRFQFSQVAPGIDRYQTLSGAIDWLNKANLIIQTPIIQHIEFPLKAFGKERLFKLYCLDVGILGAMSQLPVKTLLDFSFGGYKGFFVENFVAQQLQAFTEETFFCWQKERHEIEFIQVIDGEIIPIEVKAGHITRAKSLDRYDAAYQPAYSIVLSGKLPKKDPKQNRLYLPLYTAPCVSHLSKIRF